MDDVFNIYIDRLRHGQELKISEKISPEFLDVHEKDLSFKKDVELEGIAYLAEQELILHWNTIKAEALISCSICNEKVPVEIEINDFYYNEPISNIKNGIFNFKDVLRETILLEVPLFAECEDGNCPRRQDVAKYLKDKPKNKSDEEDGYQPFADLDLK